MFGPNTYIDFPTSITHSHRDKEFMNTFEDLRDLFIDVFDLQDYDILFIGGSGTTAIESVVWSMMNNIEVIGSDGVFKNKWERLVRTYGKVGSSKYYREKLYCQLETSNSTYCEEKDCMVDAISSFPYYDIPKEFISDELAIKWNLYGLQTKSKSYQIFTYSCDDKSYEDFAKDLRSENIIL